MGQLLILLVTIFDDKLVTCHLIFLRTLHTVAKILEWSFRTILWEKVQNHRQGF